MFLIEFIKKSSKNTKEEFKSVVGLILRAINNYINYLKKMKVRNSFETVT